MFKRYLTFKANDGHTYSVAAILMAINGTLFEILEELKRQRQAKSDLEDTLS